METLDPDSAIVRDMDDSGCVQDESPTKLETETDVAAARINLLDLSDDVLLYILRNCEPRDLKALGFTCPRLGALVRDRSLWRHVRERSQPTGRARLRWYMRRALGAHTQLLSITGYSHDSPSASVEQDDPAPPAPSTSAAPRAPASEEPRAGPSRGDDEPAYPEEPAHPVRLPATYCIRGTDNRQTPRLRSLWEDSGAPGGVRWTVSPSLLHELTARCPHLTVLELDHCNIDCADINLSQFPRSLRSLSLEGAKCYNLPVDKSFMFRVHDYLPHLESVNVSGCAWVCGAALLPLSKLRRLRVLHARGCRRLAEFVAYASLAARYGFRHLKVLDVRGSPLADSEVSAFGWLPELEELYCSVQQPEPTPPGEGGPELHDWEKQEPEYFKEPLQPEDIVRARSPSPPPAPLHPPSSSLTITFNRKQVDANHSDAHPVDTVTDVHVRHDKEIQVDIENGMDVAEEEPNVKDVSGETDNQEAAGINDQEIKEDEERDLKMKTNYNDQETGEMENQEIIPEVKPKPIDIAAAQNNAEAGDNKAPEIPEEQDDQQAGGMDREIPEEQARDLRIDSSQSDDKPFVNNETAIPAQKKEAGGTDNNQQMEVEATDLRIDGHHNEDGRNNDNAPEIADPMDEGDTEKEVNKQLQEESRELRMDWVNEAGPSNSKAVGTLDAPGPSYANPPEVKDLSTARKGLKRKPDVDIYDDDDEDEPAVKKPFGRDKDGASTSNGNVQKFVKFRRNCPPVVITNSGNGEIEENGLNLVKKEQNGTAVANGESSGDNDDKTNSNENLIDGDGKKESIKVDNMAVNGVNQQQNANAAVIIERHHNGDVVNVRNPRHVIIDHQLNEVDHQQPAAGNQAVIPEQAQAQPAVNNRYHVLYVNVGRQLHAVYQLSADFEVLPNRQMPDQEPRLDIRNIYRQMRFPYVRNVIYGPPTPHIDPCSLITDSALRRFGRSDGEDINYVHIGSPRPNDASTERPSKSRLRVLVCTGYSGVTNSSLSHLATAAPDLVHVDVTGTKVTEQGVAAFKSLRPDCEVLYGSGHSS